MPDAIPLDELPAVLHAMACEEEDVPVGRGGEEAGIYREGRAQALRDAADMVAASIEAAPPPDRRYGFEHGLPCGADHVTLPTLSERQLRSLVEFARRLADAAAREERLRITDAISALQIWYSSGVADLDRADVLAAIKDGDPDA